MNIRKASIKKVGRKVKSFFGADVPWERQGNFVLVHVDVADEAIRKERAESFDPGLFFDPNCPHCVPFLTDGAFMIYDGPSLVGLRILGGNAFETVMLNEPAQAVVN